MADEVSGEESGADAGEDFYGERREIIGEVGEARKASSASRGSLLSDFCKPEYGESAEEQGEGYWVCRPQEEEGGYYEGKWPYDELEAEGEELEDVLLEEKRTLDSQYLKSVLGTPLTFGLLDISMKRPTDPIQYLAHFLLRWRWCGEDKTKYENKMAELSRERELYIEQVREREKQAMLDKEERDEELRRAEREESSIESDDQGEGHDLIVEE